MDQFPEGEVCPHAFDDASFKKPKHTDTVCRDECAYCCSTDKHAGGLFVCTQCFVGCCPQHVEKHRALEPTHAQFVRIETATQYPDQPPVPTDASKLGVPPPKVVNVRVYCADCGVNFKLEAEYEFAATAAATAIVNANAPANDPQDAAAAAWGNMNVPCQHTNAQLKQMPNAVLGRAEEGKRGATEKEKCGLCECNKNNWMCLTCGHIGCPRKEAGGNEHGIFHFMMTGHPLVVKLGTVTPVRADVHCYACQQEITSYPEMAQHLAHFGIIQQTAVKTAKSLAEMEMDAALKHDYDTIQEEGAKLVPLYGPGLTGLGNFGNTCYISSILQVLLATGQPFLRAFVSTSSPSHMASCKRSQPLNCLECQVERVLRGMLSGRFSIGPPAPKALLLSAANDDDGNISAAATASSAQEVENYRTKMLREDRNGIEPKLFKQIVAGSNAEWKSGRQQDAEEYFCWLMATLRKGVATTVVPHPGRLFQYAEELRRSCSKCGAVRYSYTTEDTLPLRLPVEAPPPLDPKAKLTDAELEARRVTVTFPQMLQDYLAPSSFTATCSHCHEKGATYTDTKRLATFPDFIAIKARREFYCRASQSVRKLDAKVEMPLELDLTPFAGSGGFQPGKETWLSEEVSRKASMPRQDAAATASTAPPATGGGAASFVLPNEDLVAMLTAMDFPEDKVRWALHKTNNDGDAAVAYIFDKPDEPTPANLQSLSDAAAAASAGKDAASQQQQQQEEETKKKNEDDGNSNKDGSDAKVDAPIYLDQSSVGTNGPPGKYELYAMASHMGQNATSGHWIAHAKHPEHGWVIFNDAKVAKSQSPPFTRATIYFYRRIGGGAAATSEDSQ